MLQSRDLYIFQTFTAIPRFYVKVLVENTADNTTRLTKVVRMNGLGKHNKQRNK